MMSIPLEQYTLPLALEDLIPVLGSTIGLLFLARWIRTSDATAGAVALWGVLCVTLGGASKASWKLLVAVTHADGAPFLERSLFGFMAPGFVLVAVAMLAVTGVAAGGRALRLFSSPVASAILVAACFTAAQTGIRAAELVLLSITIIASTTVGVQAIRAARAAGRTVAAALFAFNLTVAFALGAIGAREQTITLQWTEQILNSVSQSAFAFAAFTLARTRTTEEVAA